MDVIHRDTVDRDLERLLVAGASTDTASDPTMLEASYLESVRRFNARARAENRAAWCEYHRDAAARHRAVLEDLITHHEAEAEKLMETNEQRRTA